MKYFSRATECKCQWTRLWISVDVATAAAHGTMFTLSRDQLAAAAPWPHIGHHNAQWASNSGNLNWQQQWRGRGEAGRLGGTVPGDTTAWREVLALATHWHRCTHTILSFNCLESWAGERWFLAIKRLCVFCIYLFMPDALFEMYRVCYFF